MAPTNKTKRLDLYMKANKMSARALAEKAGVTPAVISRILREEQDRTWMVEELKGGRLQVWEKLSSPWRQVKTKNSAPKKWAK